MKKSKGFSLPELLVVIVILGVLISIAIPSYISITNNVKENNYKQKMDTIIFSFAAKSCKPL